MSDSGGLAPADKLSIAALVVSLVAAVVVSVQLFQTVLSNATGLPSRDEKVMGKWATKVNLKSQGIKYLWLRAEVDFESPIIFLARKDNEHGPLPSEESPIYYAHGTKDSCDEYRIAESDLERRDSEESGLTLAKGRRKPTSTILTNIQQDSRERVTTVANERVTWLTLLAAIQRMERDSNRWERTRRTQGNIRPPINEDTTLKVGIQIKSRSFDANPAVKKPYATTTICHMVELAAVLGLYWKEFDRDRERYRAEGNGYFLLGTRLPNFGIVFTFERTGWVEFGRTRLIQAPEIKELCFGNVPSFYRNRESDWEWGRAFSGQAELETLQLGSWDEIAETLRLIGCNTSTRLYYLDEGYQHRHLFPVIFEVVGMLARTLQIKDRCFTYLPNPTIFAWDKKSFSLERLRCSFDTNINALKTKFPGFDTPTLKQIVNQSDRIKNELRGRERDFTPDQLEVLHNALDKTDEILGKDGNKKYVVLDVLRRHLQEVHLAINTSVENVTSLGKAPSNVRKRLAPNQQKDVTEVVHQHLSELLSAIERLQSLNKSNDKEIPPKGPPAHVQKVSAVGGEISFQDLLTLPPEDKESELMDKYFKLVRPRVIVTENEKYHDQAALAASRAIHDHNPPQQDEDEDEDKQRQEYPDQTAIQNQATGGGDPSTDPALAAAQTSGGPLRGVSFPVAPKQSGTAYAIQKPPTKDEIERNEIWCTLIFRMICWLTLHDFAKEDIQLPKSALMGNRLPVYIL